MFESLSKLCRGYDLICKESYLAKLITSPCNVHTDIHYSSCTRQECNATVHTNKMHIHPQVTHDLKCFILLRTTAEKSLASAESYH